MLLKLTAGYRLDFTQISRIVGFCAKESATESTGADLAERLGMSYARLQRLWMIASALGIAQKGRWRTTELGSLTIHHDEFLADVGSLWLLHYFISSNIQILIWNLMINRIIPENPTFDMVVVKSYLPDVIAAYSETTQTKHINKEIGSFLDAYLNQAFAELKFLCRVRPATFGYGDAVPVPRWVFLAATLLYRERYAPGAATLDIPTLASAPNSPGRVFALNERRVRDLLEAVEGPGGIYVESRADLDQVRFPADLTFLDTVRRYYEER